MTTRMKSLGIDQLSRDEQIELVYEICDSLEASDADEPLTDAQKQEIDRRLDAITAVPVLPRGYFDLLGSIHDETFIVHPQPRLPPPVKFE